MDERNEPTGPGPTPGFDTTELDCLTGHHLLVDVYDGRTCAGGWSCGAPPPWSTVT